MITLTGYILSQTPPPSSGFEIIELISRLGIVGLLTLGYWMERNERLASQKRERDDAEARDQMLERMLPIITEATAALRAMNQLQENLTERATQVGGRELTDLADRIDVLSQELRSSRRSRGE